MVLRIRDVLQLSSLEGAKLIGGISGLDNAVTNIMVMEAPDIERWMEPGQLLLTSLFGLQHYADAQIIAFIKRVSLQKGSGIIAKIDRFVSTIPQAMIDTCDAYAIPLIRISLERRYLDIMTQVMQVLFDSKAFILNYYHDVHTHFNKLALTQPTFLQMLTLLQSFVNNPVALLNHQGELLCTTDPCLPPAEWLPGEKMEKIDFMTYDYERLLATGEASSDAPGLIRGLIPNIGNDHHFLLIAEKNSMLRPVDFMAIENAISFLQMELIKKFALSETRQNYINDLIDDLLSGKSFSQDKLREALADLKLSESDEYRIVVMQLLPKQDVGDETQNKKQLQRLVDKFSAYFKRAIYRIRSERLVYILPVLPVDTEAFKERVAEALSQVLSNYFDGAFGYYVCIGVPCRVAQFQKAFIQSQRALEIARGLRQGSFIVSVDDMGIYRYLIDSTDGGKLLELVPPPLLRLVKDDATLANTLLTFLDANQNLQKSADLLYVHPKTIRYRIDKIRSLTKIDFDDPEQLLQYNMGFRILRVLEQLGGEFVF